MDPKNDSLQRGFSLQVSFAFSDGWKKKHTQTQMLTLVDPTAGVNLQPNGLIDDLRTISRPFRSIGIFMDDCYQGAMVQLRTALLHFFGSQCV